MPVIVESRLPEIVVAAEEGAKQTVAEITDHTAAGARVHLIARGSGDTGGLLDSVEGHSDGFEGEISAGGGLPDARAVYVELGTGVRGSVYEFPGKPTGVTYDMNWSRGIPKDPAHGFAYLIPALEEERVPLEEQAAEWYR
jgi:hypothetical protein